MEREGKKEKAAIMVSVFLRGVRDGDRKRDTAGPPGLDPGDASQHLEEATFLVTT